MTAADGACDCPSLRSGVRLQQDAVRQRPVLLYPEGVVFLNDTAAAVVRLLDGAHDVEGIVDELGRAYDQVSREDVTAVVRWLGGRRLLAVGDA